MNQTIPIEVLKPLAAGVWKSDEYACNKFATLIKSHHESDHQHGLTCFYETTSKFAIGITSDELSEIVEAGAIDPSFHFGTRVNQHWEHSLEQFYAVVTKEWNEHLSRTAALLGTPSGVIARPANDQLSPTITKEAA